MARLVRYLTHAGEGGGNIVGELMPLSIRHAENDLVSIDTRHSCQHDVAAPVVRCEAVKYQRDRHVWGFSLEQLECSSLVGIVILEDESE